MSIRFQCECGKKLKATDDKIGKRVLCPDCGQPVTVPTKDRLHVESLDSGTAQPEQDSAKTAKELLKLSAAASKENQDDEDSPKPQVRQRGEEATFTLAEATRHYGTQYVLPLTGIVVGFFLVLAFAYWTYGPKSKYPPLFPVSGTVTLDGSPLADAQLIFRSQSALMATEQIGSSVGRTDNNGRYTLYYVPDVPGAVIGKHFVEVSKTGPDGIETLPAKFHSQTKLEIEVKSDKDEGYDLKLKL